MVSDFGHLNQVLGSHLDSFGSSKKDNCSLTMGKGRN